MSFWLGVLLFAFGIGVSIALHEAGHMWTARAFGMKVRRYFIGFGPTIWSTNRGGIEYGFKAIPAGGFCDIAGMTALDPVTVDEAPRAFFRKPTWQRVIVLSAGSFAHFCIGLLLLYILAVTAGLPQLGATPQPVPPVAGETSCVAVTQDPATGAPAPCDPAVPSPAAAAGIRPGDRILSVAGVPTPDFGTVATTIRKQTGSTTMVVERDGQRLDLTVNVLPVKRLTADAVRDNPNNRLETVGAIGLGADPRLGLLEAVPATFASTGTIFAATWQGLLRFPEKVPTVLKAIAGEPRDVDSPISVVGASVLGGDLADNGRWALFVTLLIMLNFFIGVFNLLPLLPLDGGHIAVNLYERVRDAVRGRLGRAKMPPVDYTRLLPITYAFIVVLGAVSLLTITADIVNPIRFK